MDAQRSPESSLGELSGASWGSPGALLSAPRLLWGIFWRSWGGYMERLGVIFLSPGDVQSENSEKLEFDDLLIENAMFLRSQGLQNGAPGTPKSSLGSSEEKTFRKEAFQKRPKRGRDGQSGRSSILSSFSRASELNGTRRKSDHGRGKSYVSTNPCD